MTHEGPIILHPDCAGAQTLAEVLASYQKRGFDARRLALMEESLTAGHIAICAGCRDYARKQRKGDADMIALPDFAIAVTDSGDLAQIPVLCQSLLRLTEDPEVRRFWRKERKGARQILLQCRR